MAGTGCHYGSLATKTGPRPPGDAWSVARRQAVYVGEDVEFEFVLQDWTGKFVRPTAIVDYCVAQIGDERLETEPDLLGRFRFQHTFEEMDEGDVMTVCATAYRQNGSRDFVRVRGEWLKGNSRYDSPDEKVTGDCVTLVAYRCNIELAIPKPDFSLDFHTGVLKLKRSDGQITSVYIDRPGRSGFHAIGPEPDGRYFIRYTPNGHELSPTGETEVEMLIHDSSGQVHTIRETVETP